MTRIACQVPPKKVPFSDDFLITADKYPNSRGAEALGLAGAGGEQLLQDCLQGRVRFLYLCHHDLTHGFGIEEVRSALDNVDFIAFQGSWDQATTQLADVLLPAAVYAEKTGTFTNCQGRVQKFSAAVPPLGSSLADLEIIARLAAKMDVLLPPLPAERIFEVIGSQVGAFAGMTYAALGDGGMQLK